MSLRPPLFLNSFCRFTEFPLHCHHFLRHPVSLVLFNTLGRKKQPFTPLSPPEVSFYTCGPTVYNYAHIGNFRAYIAADTLRRWLTYGHNYTVKWVLNITDVDDKTIRDSQTQYPQLSPKDALQRFTRHYENIFFEDLAALGIPKSAFFANPRATEYIPHMQDLIRSIAKKGFAKEVQGSIFFNVKKWNEANRYGKLLSLDLSALQTGNRSLADEIEKEDVADFALWKAEKPGEPSWDFDFFGKHLPGRPGWHIECSAMEKELFGLPFDIHSGGVDLIFPHHEDEIAQSCCGYGEDSTRFWVHNEHLLVDGKKMSKSLGNFYTLRDLQKKGFSPSAIRFFLATNHYRTKLNLTDDGLHAAERVLQKLSHFARLATNVEDGDTRLRDEIVTLLDTAYRDFSSGMDDDLNAPLAIAAVHALVSSVSPLSPFSAKESEKLKSFCVFVERVFGVSFSPKQSAVPPKVRELAEKREKARAEKNWALADSLRDEIAALGYTVTDTQNGFELLPQS